MNVQNTILTPINIYTASYYDESDSFYIYKIVHFSDNINLNDYVDINDLVAIFTFGVFFSLCICSCIDIFRVSRNKKKYIIVNQPPTNNIVYNV